MCIVVAKEIEGLVLQKEKLLLWAIIYACMQHNHFHPVQNAEAAKLSIRSRIGEETIKRAKMVSGGPKSCGHVLPDTLALTFSSWLLAFT